MSGHRRNRLEVPSSFALPLTIAMASILTACNVESVTDADDGENDAISNSVTFTALGPSGDNSDPDYLTSGPDDLYFVSEGSSDATQELYRSDGTAAGTEPASDLKDDAFRTSPRELTVFDNDLYLVTDEVQGETSNTDFLVTLDETVTGNLNVIASDILNDEISPGDADVEVAGGSLFFVQHDSESEHSRELFRTDGTQVGTQLVSDINANANGKGGTESSEPEDLTASGTLLFFTADGGDGDGRSLWVTDGTNAGTQELLTDADGTGDLHIGPLYAITGFEGHVFFHAFGPDAFSGQPWVSDGTVAGTQALDNSIEMSSRFARYDDNTVLFGADETLWKTDGTPTGTDQLGSDDLPGSIDSDTARLGGSLYFRSGDREIWHTDGTASGTELMMDMGIDTATSTRGRPDLFTELDGKLFFTADPIEEDTSEEDDIRLWVSDGTEAGTTAIAPSDATEKDALTPSFHDDFRLVVHDDALYFSAEFTDAGQQLWKLESTD